MKKDSKNVHQNTIEHFQALKFDQEFHIEYSMVFVKEVSLHYLLTMEEQKERS
jgi:hypothetical protein